MAFAPVPRRRASVRVTMILWCVTILTLSLVIFGSVLRWQLERQILRQVDADLTHFAHDKHGPGHGGGGHGRDHDDGPPDRDSDHREHGFPEGKMPYDREGGPAPPPGDKASLSEGGARMQPVWRREWTNAGVYRATMGDGPPDNSGYPAALPWDKAALDGFVQDKRIAITTVNLDGVGPVRVLTFPVYASADHAAGIAQLARPLQDIQDALGTLTTTLLTLIPPFLILAGVGGAFLTNRVMQPIGDMARAASRIEAQNLSGSLPVGGGDEFASLAHTFNAMLTRLNASFERQKRFTSDASHELRTPLAVIRAHTSLILQSNVERTPEQYRKTLQTIDKAAQNATRLVQDLLLLARADTDRLEMRRTPIALGEIMVEAVQSVDLSASDPHAAIHFDAPEAALAISGDAHYLLRLVTNLVENAVRYTPPTGQVHVSAYAQDSQNVLLTVADTGEGIAPEHLPHVTERFYRVDASRARDSGGSGLGLALCKNITEAHGGTLRIESTRGVGTRVLVVLPRAALTPMAGRAVPARGTAKPLPALPGTLGDTGSPVPVSEWR